MAFNLNGFNFNQSVVDSEGRVINTWAVISVLKGKEVIISSFIKREKGEYSFTNSWILF
jgi:hypothetical protein